MRQVWPLTARGTAAGALAVACFIAAGVIGSIQLIAFGVLLLALPAAAILSLHLAHREIAVTRSLSPSAAEIGGSIRVTVHVDVRTALPTTPGTWCDAVPAGLHGRTDGRFPAIGSGLRGGDRAVDLVYELEARTRGVHWLGPLELSVRDPFGIARRTTLTGDTTRVIVTPDCVELPPLTAFAGATGGMLQATATRIGQGADNLVARPWAPGDSMRRIHWRATAHRDVLMVRQEEQESTPEAIVVLDRAIARWPRPAADRPGADASFEAALSACVSAVNALVRGGYAVHAVDAEGAALCEPIPGGDSAAVVSLARRLAPATTTGAATPAALARMWSGASIGPLVLVTGTVTAADVDALASLPARSAHPVLLASAFDGDAFSRAIAVGWYAASIAPEADLGAAWAQVSHPEAGVPMTAGGVAVGEDRVQA